MNRRVRGLGIGWRRMASVSLQRQLLHGAILACALIGALRADGQTLNLGDPSPPRPEELVAARAVAAKLRENAGQFRERNDRSDSTIELLTEAQARWREIAATLLDRADPLADARVVLAGWRMVEGGPDLDRAIASIAYGDSDDEAASAEALWQLRRFAAGEPIVLTPESPLIAGREHEPVVAALRPLMEAVAVRAGNPASRDPVLQTQLDAVRAFVETEATPDGTVAELDRIEQLGERAGWVVEVSAMVEAVHGQIETVHLLDRTAWLGAGWRVGRNAAVSAILAALQRPDQAASEPVPWLRRAADCVELVEAMLELPPAARPRLEPFRQLITRWLAEEASDGSSASWSALSEALTTVSNRRGPSGVPSQHELRQVCKALDDQSDELESILARLLGRLDAAALQNDPEWITVLGQHRTNVATRYRLAQLPDAVDDLSRLDRRAPASIWQRLAANARLLDDPRARDALLRDVERLVRFRGEHRELAMERDWSEPAPWLGAITSDQGAGVRRRLEVLRAARARELVEDSATVAIEQELDAMRDLFRLVATWRWLQEAGDEAITLFLPVPRESIASSRAKLEHSLRRAVDEAPAGGVQFIRAVEAVRREGAAALVLEQLHQAASKPRGGEVLENLQAVILLVRDPSSEGEATRTRLEQWAVLQFEAARRAGSAGVPPRSVAVYRDFLEIRIAAAAWVR